MNKVLLIHSRTKPYRKPLRKADTLVTVGMLHAVRDELKADFAMTRAQISGLAARMDSFESRMESFESRLQAFETRIQAVEIRLDAVVDLLNSRFDEVISVVQSEFHKISLLVEEQNSRHSAVYDGLNQIFAKQATKSDRIQSHLICRIFSSTPFFSSFV